MKTIGPIIAVVLLTAGGLFSCVTQAMDRRITECEQAWEDYVMGPPDMQQPSILTEDWCFNHLMEQGDTSND